MSAGADTRAILWGGGALQGDNVRLVEDGSECGGALNSDVVVTETANKGQGEDGGRVSGLAMGADREALGAGSRARQPT